MYMLYMSQKMMSLAGLVITQMTSKWFFACVGPDVPQSVRFKVISVRTIGIETFPKGIFSFHEIFRNEV